MIQKKTIKEVSILWKEDKKQYVKLSTFSAYTLILENHIYPTFGEMYVNPEKPDVPINKNDAFQKVQKRRVQEKR